MFCPYCSASVDGLKFCGQCGKQVPALAEKAATKEPNDTGSLAAIKEPNDGEALKGLLAILVTIGILWAAFSLGTPSTPEPVRVGSTTQSTPTIRSGTEVVVKAATACALGVLSGSKLNSVIEAAQRGDRAAIAGLIARKEVLPIEEGTRALVLSFQENTVLVRLLSGFNMGERCWLHRAVIE